MGSDRTLEQNVLAAMWRTGQRVVKRLLPQEQQGCCLGCGFLGGWTGEERTWDMAVLKVELTGSTCDWWNMGIKRKKKSQRTPRSGSEIGNVRGEAVWGWQSEGMNVTEITSLVLESLKLSYNWVAFVVVSCAFTPIVLSALHSQSLR